MLSLILYNTSLDISKCNEGDDIEIYRVGEISIQLRNRNPNAIDENGLRTRSRKSESLSLLIITKKSKESYF